MKGIGRRRFLRGGGASLLLPALPSAMPRAAWSDPLSPPKRVIYYYVPNGFDMASLLPSTTGPSWTMPTMMQALAPHQSDLLMLTEVHNEPGNRRDSDANAGAHFQQTASLLTCAHVDAAPFSNGISIDQVLAQQLPQETPFRSLHLSLSAGGGGSCGSNWPCSYFNNISWRDATTPIANRSDPAGLFHSLFNSSLGVSEAEFEQRRAQQLKIMDVVREDANSLSVNLSAYDQRKLEQYLTAVNEFESTLLAQQWGLSCDPGAGLVTAPIYTDRLEQMLDVMVLALQCDMSRIFTFMSFSGGASHSIPYDWVSVDGVPITETFHTVSHHGNNPDKLAKIAAINQWEFEVLAGFLDRLATTLDVDGSRLLDNTLVVFTSECSDGDSHSASDLPIVLAGNLDNGLITGQHLAMGGVALADLHMTVAKLMGLSLNSFGEDGTGVLSQVLR